MEINKFNLLVLVQPLVLFYRCKCIFFSDVHMRAEGICSEHLMKIFIS
jgi:hypothetical protein